MKNRIIPLFSATLLICSMIPLSSAALEVETISMPCADILLAFVMTGRVSEIKVTQGDIVKEGALLASLDNRAEKIKVEELKANAENKTRIQMATAELNQKTVDLKKMNSAHNKGAVTRWELEHAELNARIARLALQAAKLDYEQDQRRYRQAVSQLDRMQLVSPISGHVEKIMVSPGESVKSLDPVIQVIQTDPLWIDVPVPLSLARELALGQSLPVSFTSDDGGESTDGNIIHISSVVDAASDTFTVRLEVPNPTNHKAGERVLVKVSDDESMQQTNTPPAATEAKIDDLTIQAPDQDK